MRISHKVAQQLAQYSTMTMDVYSHADQGEFDAAVRSQPAPAQLGAKVIPLDD